ncbi:MAG: transcriptional antiterminator, Rof [Gammaproteobacteria bacterium]|nr:transcriptional antiterminator, Rof [Gammaproteobacteria bacterium]
MHGDDPYTPIDCGLYSQYEVAILHRTPLQLRWHDEAGREQNARILPRDLQIRDHVEYLLVEDSNGATFAVRLDHILCHQTES